MAIDDTVTQFDPNPSDVIDRVNNPDVLTADQYQNRLVDFYRQTLGSTGIQTTKPAEDEDEKEDYVAPTIVTGDSGDDQDMGLPITNIGGENVLDFKNTTDSILNMDLPASYQDHLENNNRADKSDLSKFEKSMNNQFSKLEADFNKNAQKNFGIGIDLPDAKQAQKYASTQMLGAMLGVANPFVGMVGASMVSGKTETNIQGTGGQFKPGGMLGIVQDINKSLELNAYNANQAAYKKVQDAYSRGSVGQPDFNTYLRGQDVGFSMEVGGNQNLGVYREAGSRIYNGAMYGISQEQAGRIEAIGKGKVITGFNPLNPSDSSNLATYDPNRGGYAENGTYHDVRFGVSAVGRKSDAEREAKKNGLTYNQFISALTTARSGTKTLTQAIKEEKRKITPTQVISSGSGDDNIDTTVTEGDKGTPVVDGTYYEDPVADTTDPSYDSGDSSYGGDDSFDSDSDPGGTGGYSGGGFEDAFASGGRIGMQNGGNTTEVVQPAGFIAPDPNATDQQEIADDKPMDAKKGDFIINAPAAEEAGKQDIQRMIDTAITNLQEKGVDVRFGNPKMNIRDKVKLLVSRNEVYIPAVIAKEIGYDRLKKINNRGKREVQRRQEEAEQAPQQGMNNGGFIQKKKGDVVEEKTIDNVVYKEKYPSTVAARRATDKIIESLPAADALALLMQGEAKNLGDEGLEGAAHVLVNRTNAEGYKNFGQSLYKQLTAKYKGKKEKLFEFNAFEPRKFRESLKTFKSDKEQYLKVRNIAEEVLAGVRPDFTNGALFFKNPKIKGDEYFRRQVQKGDFEETNRTVSKSDPNTLHVYYIPKDFKRGTEVKPKPQMRESFISLDPDLGTRPKVRIPESKGGSFLFRGSDYERGGATPAL